MKYGDNFENESVPEWSLHNIDYNSLKHHIKAHTTKGQATAIAIPGHQDVALKKFEEEFYGELCRQHDRVGLFATSKASELSRRLQHLSDRIHDALRRSAGRRISMRRQRKLAKFELDVVQCGDEIQDLRRFVNAQVVAFRKILKKYKKWTGSPSVGTRFKENVLYDPKSFTNRDFHPLQAHYEELLSELRAAATPASSAGPATPVDSPSTPARRRSSAGQALPAEPLVVVPEHCEGYWNEYEHGSDAGDFDGGEYAIYINPDDEDENSLGIYSVFSALFSMPVSMVKLWLRDVRGGAAPEQAPLLPTSEEMAGAGAPGGYGAVATTAGRHSHRIDDHASHGAGDEADDEDEGRDRAYVGDDLDCASSEEDFPRGYEARYASLPSINDQRVSQYRDRMLFWGTVGADASAVVLLGTAALLISTGRHRLRVEVDVGVLLGVMASLCCACAALGMTMARTTRLSWLNRLAVYATFCVICVLNGVLLVLVAGNSPLSTELPVAPIPEP